MKSKAFTLAEVLITIGIIGVVAALTLPSLIENHQKKVVATKLKAFNSIMAQAFNTAKLDYGDWDNWDSNSFWDSQSNIRDGQKQLEWLQKYLLPYIKYTEASYSDKYALVALPNGSGFSNYNSLYFFCVNYSDCKKIIEDYNTRSRFIFKFSTTNGFGPYDCGWKGTREEFFTVNSCFHACSKKYTNSIGKNSAGMCAKLIQFDGWEISRDYPW